MAIGKTNRTEGKAYSLKLKLKEGEKFLDCARFDIQEKIEGAYKTTGNTDTVSGDLFRIETRVGDFEGQPIHSFKAGLRDAEKGEVYFVDVGLGSGLGRGLANSLLNLKAFSNVEIGLYPQTNRQTKKVYPAVAVRQGGSDDTVKWAYDPKAENSELPAPEEFKARGGKIEKDYTKQELFLLAKLTELGAKLGNEKPTAQTPEATAQPTRAAKPAATEQADQDVPF